MQDFARFGLVGRSTAFLRCLERIERYASCDAPVLFQGETGTGKELAARAVHYLGARRNTAFVPVNCGAIPEALIESELFGHVRGAFTDARAAHSGLIAQAQGGALFLDEIEALSAGAQVALLRFLQSREYRQYQQNVYALDMLEKIPDLPCKKFVYAHLYITHQQFVFYPDGRFHPNLLQTDAACKDQILFTQVRMIEIVKTILAKSEKEPIIILQGDHSYPDGIDRVKILNAYYLPDGGNENLYETITPVNTFRVIFKTYFGGQYEMLPDISRYADADKVLHEAPSSCAK